MNFKISWGEDLKSRGILGNSSPLSRRQLGRPFVKWVGGKSQLVSELTARIPKDVKRFYEPFVGGGALLFAVNPYHAYISDINPELINAYRVVKDNVDALIRDLKKHKYQENYYYQIRDADRLPSYRRWSPVRRASRLIFLNKTCYNGLYRVNSQGHFNTPFGRYTNPTIVDEGNLRACSKVLKRVAIDQAPFESVLDLVKAKDFVYFDPPYLPLSKTANFTNYNRTGFGLDSQKKLAAICRLLDKRGIRFMLSNSSAPLIFELYRKYRIELVSATRAINSKATKRGAVKEVIVTNY